MAKKHMPPREQADRPKEPKAVFTSPFKDLKKLFREQELKRTPTAPNSPPKLPPPSKVVPVDEATLLQEAMAGVRPIGAASAARLPLQPAKARKPTVVSEDAEVLAQLYDLISGQGA